MTEQEIFDTVLTLLRYQGKASVSPTTENCLYRGPDGAKCAVGWLISDDEYSDEMEGYDVKSIILLGMSPKWLKEHLELLDQLQVCHDNDLANGSLKEWEKAMSKIAKDFGLVYSEPKAYY